MEDEAKRREELRLKRQMVEEAKALRELLVQTERKMARIGRDVAAGSPVSADDLAAWQSWNAPDHTASSSSSSGKRKRKKRRKRRTPRSSSYSSYGPARRRKRQWHALYAGFLGDVPLRAVFSSVVVRPEMSGITSGMDQKDNGALIVDSGSGMCKARFPGFSARCVFPLVVGRPAGRSVWTRSTFTQLAGFTGDDVPRAVLPFFLS